MFNSDTLATKAGAILIEKTERRLDALLAEHGASDPSELPRAVQGQLLQRATLETAATNFPAGNLKIFSLSCGNGSDHGVVQRPRRCL